MIFTVICKNKITGRKVAISCIAGSFSEIRGKISGMLPGLQPISIIYELEKNQELEKNS